MTPPEPKHKPELSSIELVFAQEGDCCGGGDSQYLTLTSHDGGGGAYWTLKTERWAIDSPADLHSLIELAKEAAEAAGGFPQ